MKSTMLDSAPNADSGPEVQSEHPMPLMELIGVHKFLDGRHVLKGIDLRIEKGKVTCILGPSGSGKTTLLKCLDLLKLIDIGEIRFNGTPIIHADSQDLRPWSLKGMLNLMAYGTLKNCRFKRQLFVRPHEFRRRVAVVFQEFNLWPNLTVLSNLIQGPVLAKGQPRKSATEKAFLLMQQFGLGDTLQRYPRQLSGGQRQRVAIARALMMETSLIFADELTSALDPELVGEVLGILRELAFRKTTMVIVTHHLHFAKEIADHVVILDQGQIAEQGPAKEVLLNPSTDRTRRFLGLLNAGQ
jgi:ABC-type polar amino acid transport system ATPase subunit